jgi:hypothetical protein
LKLRAVPRLAVGIDEMINIASKIKNNIRKGKIIEYVRKLCNTVVFPGEHVSSLSVAILSILVTTFPFDQ